MTETPAIIVGTNSYAGLAQADAIAAANLFNDRWKAADDDRRTRALMTATAMLDRLPWKGRPAKPDQPLAWPRVPFRTSLPQIAADIVPAIVTATVLGWTAPNGIAMCQSECVARLNQGSRPWSKLPA